MGTLTTIWTGTRTRRLRSDVTCADTRSALGNGKRPRLLTSRPPRWDRWDLTRRRAARKGWAADAPLLRTTRRHRAPSGEWTSRGRCCFRGRRGEGPDRGARDEPARPSIRWAIRVYPKGYMGEGFHVARRGLPRGCPRGGTSGRPGRSERTCRRRSSPGLRNLRFSPPYHLPFQLKNLTKNFRGSESGSTFATPKFFLHPREHSTTLPPWLPANPSTTSRSTPAALHAPDAPPVGKPPPINLAAIDSSNRQQADVPIVASPAPPIMRAPPDGSGRGS